MTFTYKGTLATDLDKVRFYLGDNIESSGPLPDSSNFEDEEINGLITTEGSWQRAVAAGLENLAVRYGNIVDLEIGPRREFLSQAARSYLSQAKEWRDKHGQKVTSSFGTAAITRTDGYSNDVAADDV